MTHLSELSRQEFDVKSTSSSASSTMPLSEVILRGSPTGRFVSGAVLEAAVAANGHYVVFMTDDVPFEDMLTIEYLDKNLDRVDRVRLGWPYSTGSFSDLELQPPNKIRFRFIGDTVWTLELLPAKEFVLPFLGNSRGVWRPGSFYRRMKLLGQPKPDVAKRSV